MVERISITGITSLMGSYNFPNSEIFARRKVYKILPVPAASETTPLSSSQNLFAFPQNLPLPGTANISMYLTVNSLKGERIMQNVPLAALLFSMPLWNYRLTPFYFAASTSTLQIVNTNYLGDLPGSVEFEFYFE